MVDVNDSGQAFVEEARLSELHGERAFQAAQRAARGVDVVLNVGRSPYTNPFLVTTLLSVQLPLFPRLGVDLTSQFSCDLVHQLLEGRLDLAIATEPPESPLMTTVKIDEAPFYIAMSERDKLAACPSVNLDDMLAAAGFYSSADCIRHSTTRLCEELRFGEFSQPESSM